MVLKWIALFSQKIVNLFRIKTIFMHLKWNFKACIFFSLLFSFHSYAQKPAKDFNFVDIKEGISKVGIYTITQDHYGFIWIGTNGSGLYKFDGIDYTSYKFKHQDSTSISSNLIFSSYLAKDNKLWIGTEDGLNLYNRDLDKFKKINITESQERNISVLSINEYDGNLYIGTRLNGLFKYNLETQQTQRIPTKDKSGPAINSIQINKDGIVFLGTSLGLKQLNTAKTEIIKPYLNSNSNIDVDAPIQSMLLVSKNNLWAGTYSQGVYKYNFQNSQLSGITKLKISQKRILSIIEKSDKSILVGSENDGLFHINSNGSIIKNYLYSKTDKNSIRSNSIWSLFKDKNERIWMGYYNNGVVISDDYYDKFNNIKSLANNKNSLQTGSVTGIVKDDNNNLWITMDGGGIDVFDSNSNKVEHINVSEESYFKGLTSNYIQTIFIDSKKTIWAGSWDNGFYFLKKGAKKFTNINIQNSKRTLLSNAILSFEEDKDGIIWIGTFYTGLYSYNPNTEKLKHYNTEDFLKYNINTSDVRKILVDIDGAIWVGTTSGLFKIDKINENHLKVTSFIKPMTKEYNNQKSSIHILSLYEGSDNNIWIGTRGAGLSKFDKNKNQFTWYNKFSGLNEENIAGIIEDLDKNIWISGNSGITKLNISENGMTNYTTNDGLLSDDFNFNATFRDKNGELYFGNYKGVDFFNPKDLKTNTTLPSLYLTGLKIFNKDVIPNKENSPLNKVITETNSLKLNYKQSVFTIEYTGINYTRSEKNQYAYYLEGFEKTWNYVGNQRSATYTNLDYGDYTFKLKSANNDGIWNEEPLELKIKISPPWWKTTVAIMAYFILFILGILLLNKITQNRVKEKQLIKNERSQRIQEDKLHKKKIQFFTNISHEFRTPLTLILNPLKDIMRDENSNLPERIKSKHNTIYRNTNRLYALINELMDLRKLELNKMRIRASKLNLINFTKDIVEYYKEEALSRNIFLSLDADISDIQVWADESMLEKIIFNILSNAMKVTPDNGSINVELIDNDTDFLLPLLSETEPVKVVEIVISDTGPGLEEEQIDKIFKRFYQVDSLNKTYYGGTGIGLEVVSSFVKLHKGKIEVSSKVGEGTTFKIILPKGKSHLSKDEIMSFKKESDTDEIDANFIPASQIEIEKKQNLEADNIQKKHTILVVEDNTELRNYLKSELSINYKVLIALNGKEGLEIAQKSFPDVILTDVIMPEMDGFEFCKRIKTNIKTSHIPLLMLTAKSRIDDRIEGIEYGSDAYMTKPFDMRLLSLRLSQLITSRKLIFDKYFSEVSGAKENVNTTSIDKEFINKVLAYIGDNISKPSLSVENLASELNLSRSQLYRKIKLLTGQTVNELVRKIRLERAHQMLQTGSSFVNEVCYKVGFSSPSYFTKCFKAHFGVLPTEIEIKDNDIS